MNSYAVFLRGINVGGINIKMAELRDALASAGFEGVKTLLASGNVVLASDEKPAAVKQKFEKCLRDAFGYDAWVVVLTAQRVAELVEACPYPEDDKATHTYITVASDTARLDELDAAGAALEGSEQTAARPGGPGLARSGGRNPRQPVQQDLGQAEVQGEHHHPEPADPDQSPGRRSRPGVGVMRFRWPSSARY